MADELKIKVNGRDWPVAASPDTPLLYVLIERVAAAGAAIRLRAGAMRLVLGAGQRRRGPLLRDCRSRPSKAKSVTTLEGLPAFYASQKGLAEAPALHPLQQALIDEQAAQCGYCFNGMIIKGSELLSKTPQPDRSRRSAPR